ncbi:MAG: hypothetical protein WD467_00980 [Candidatus Saccharimonadales bacterium]
MSEREYSPVATPDPKARDALAEMSTGNGDAGRNEQPRGRNLKRIVGGAAMAGVALFGVHERINPEIIGYGEKPVTADSLDEAVQQIDGINSISMNAAKSGPLHQETSSPGNYIVADRVEVKVDSNPFDNGVRRESDSRPK